VEIPLARLQQAMQSLILKRYKAMGISLNHGLDNPQMTRGRNYRVKAKVLKNHLEITGQELNPSIIVPLGVSIRKQRITKGQPHIEDLPFSASRSGRIEFC